MQLLYFSPVPWSSFAQRPHKLIDWFQAKTKGEVLWVDPYPTRLPKLTDWYHYKQVNDAPTNINFTKIQILKPASLPIEPIPFSGIINNLLWIELNKKIASFIKQDLSIIGVGKPSLLALQTLKKFNYCHSFYDAMDDFPAFYSGISKWSMTKKEVAIVKKTSYVLTSSTALYNSWYTIRNDIQLVPNALDANTLPATDTRSIKPHKSTKVLGYIGTVADWFDWDWLIHLANLRPFDTIEIIGPIYTSPPFELPSNVHIKPPLEHKEAVQTMLRFDIGLIPFKKNKLTHSVDPIKYYEYCALGLPILSTSFGEMFNRRNNEEVFIVDDLADMSFQINQALSYQANHPKLEQFIYHNTWQHRFDNCRLLF
ncbi:hypothetical protein [Thiofilum flexile]|uniref:hypothetical protein n=1 Tax=Thiofilum flexile TaxID=125627 RepID=UPI00037EA260|nr:hypothetical protein [Thiofilum flexile]